MSTPLPHRPRLRQDTVVLETPEGVFVRGAGDSFLVRGAGAYRYLSALSPHLNGSTTLEEITAGLPEAHVDAVRSLLSRLAARGVVFDAPEPGGVVGEELRERFEAQVSLLEHHGDDGRGFLRLAEARVVVVSDTARGGSELADALAANGVGAAGEVAVRSFADGVDASGADLVCLLAVDGPQPRLLEHARAARTAGAAVLPLLRVGHRLVVGPWQGPDGGVDVCSLLLRLSDNAVPEVLGMWQAVGAGVAAPALPPLPGAAASMAVAIMGFEVFKSLSGVLASDVADRAVVVDSRFLTARGEPVVAHPAGDAAPTPRDATAVEDPTDVEDAYTRFEGVVAETTGIMGRFDDDALPQIPVKVSVLHAPAVRPEPIAAFASDTVMRARLTALEAASAEYALGVHRRCALLPGAAGDARSVEARLLETWLGTALPESRPVAARDMADGTALAVEGAAVLAGPWDRDAACFEPALTGLAAAPTAREAAERALRDAAAARVLALAARGRAPLLAVGPDLLDKVLDGAERARLAMFAAELDGPGGAPELLAVPGAVPVAVVRTARRTLARHGATWAEAAETALRELAGHRQVAAEPGEAPGGASDLTGVPAATLDDPSPLRTAGGTEQVLARLAADGRRAALLDLTPPDLAGVTHVARVLLYRTAGS
ncbi:hypothetical protein NI17_005250 [Thermobifida halotolerans]|uniref:YcaO domain-containing protein n=1 Tax=Thermobifida halotolerans TaxID=483545 RepID=A0AA97M4S1_9ACTN|nr:hypothetical protein [Thermobifida halotolerans]UOE20624.1 hypothetical protein NI17_005250 [Thermobifida halotolerans]